MSSTTALMPYRFEGQLIRVSTDEHGEAWFTAADVAAALGQQPIAKALTNLREEEQCLYSQEGPGSEGCTLALISEGGLLRLLLLDDNQTAWRMRRWLTHELLPAIARSQQGMAAHGARTIEAIRRQTAAEVLLEADEIIDLTGVPQAEALLSVLEGLRGNSGSAGTEVQQRSWQRAGATWLRAGQLAERLDRTLRSTNQQLAAAGFQLRNDDDDWQLTEAGRDWAVTRPLCSKEGQRLEILWDPAVLPWLNR
jgi:prophage antirepressor-like protein